jgi:hypothetical protein
MQKVHDKVNFTLSFIGKYVPLPLANAIAACNGGR